MKTCTKCNTKKPLSDYYRQKQGDGRRPDCKACVKDRVAKHSAQHEVKARTSARMAAYQARPEVRGRIANYQAEYRARTDVRERKSEYLKAYRAENVHKWWESDFGRRSAAYGFEPVVESFTKADVIARYGDSCWHCGGTFEEIDHWPLPISRGGAHSLDNCVPSCRDCNQRSWRTESV